MLNLKGTKFGCGKAACGACTLHVDGEAVRSCSYPVKYAEGKKTASMERRNRTTMRLLPTRIYDGNGSYVGKNSQSH